MNQSVKKKTEKPVRSVAPTPPPLWQGPSIDGITQSMVSRYLCCKERFRLLVIDGMKEQETFANGLEYGNLWHICEETLAAGRPHQQALNKMAEYCQILAMKYPTDRPDINKLYCICGVQFPIYVKHWSQHPDVRNRKPLLQETPFKVPYTLPSGRTILLRGKFDSVDLIDGKLYIQENKTKSEFDPQQLLGEMSFNLQTMLYTIALGNLTADPVHKKLSKTAIGGIRYNVIRRPLSRGKFCITQKKGRKTKNGIVGAETSEQFYARLGKTIVEAGNTPGYESFFFWRCRAEIMKADIVRFKRECLDPILENLLDDYEWWNFCHVTGKSQYDYSLREEQFPNHRSRHFRLPFGIWNPLLHERQGSYHEYLRTGSYNGLIEVDNLFPEL